MIIRSSPLGSPWKRGAAAFFMFNSLSIFMIWMISEIVRRPQENMGGIMLVITVFSGVLYLCGAIFKVRRLKYVILILGVFVAGPMLIFNGLIFFLFMELANYDSGRRILLSIFYVAAILSWGIFKAGEIIRLEKKFSYFEAELDVQESIAYFSQDDAQDLSNLKKRSKTGETVNKKIASILMPMVFLGYPLQRVLADTGGDAAVFAFMAILSVPLSIYIAGKMFSGYFLWVHLGGKFEKKFNAQIFLRESTVEGKSIPT